MPADQATVLRDLAGRRARPPVPPRFTVRVLAWDVDVVLTDEPLFDRGGHPAYGLHDWDNRRILIAADAPPALRLNVLCHEVWHCYRCEFSEPLSVEADCNLFAMAAEAVVNALMGAGGLDALLALRPSDAV